MENKDYEFFITQIGKNFSIYYAFIPFVVLVLFGEKDKKFQKINLSFKDSIKLVKYEKDWGMISTLFKCMFLDTKNNKIFFKFELLEKNKNDIYNTVNTINSEHKKSYLINNNDVKNVNIKNEINSRRNKIKKILLKNNTLAEKETEEKQIKYKDSMYEISLLDCTLRKITINSDTSEDKYYIIPKKLLDSIFSLKDEKKFSNINFEEIPLISKYIGENIPSILSAKEFDNISEENKMEEKADIVENESKKELPKVLPKIDTVENQIPNNQRIFISSKVLNIQTDDIIEKEIEERKENKKKTLRVEKRYSNKYVFPKGIFFARSDKKRVSIANSNELRQNRFDNIVRDIVKRRTMKLKDYN